jgi:acyl carrier protein
MMASTTFEKVRSASADIFQMPAGQITPSSSPETIENWDSVQHLNLVLALEEKFGIQFEPEEMDKMNSVGEITDLVDAKLKGN